MYTKEQLNRLQAEDDMETIAQILQDLEIDASEYGTWGQLRGAILQAQNSKKSRLSQMLNIPGSVAEKLADIGRTFSMNEKTLRALWEVAQTVLITLQTSSKELEEWAEEKDFVPRATLEAALIEQARSFNAAIAKSEKRMLDAMAQSAEETPGPDDNDFVSRIRVILDEAAEAGIKFVEDEIRIGKSEIASAAEAGKGKKGAVKDGALDRFRKGFNAGRGK